MNCVLFVPLQIGARSKVTCTHRAWQAPMGMCGAGGWGPGMQSFVSSTPPASNLCSLLQVEIPLATASLLLRFLCCLQLGGLTQMQTRGAASVSLDPHVPYLPSCLLIPRVCLCDIFCMAVPGHIYVSACVLFVCSHLGSNKDGLIMSGVQLWPRMFETC